MYKNWLYAANYSKISRLRRANLPLNCGLDYVLLPLRNSEDISLKHMLVHCTILPVSSSSLQADFLAKFLSGRKFMEHKFVILSGGKPNSLERYYYCGDPKS